MCVLNIFFISYILKKIKNNDCLLKANYYY